MTEAFKRLNAKVEALIQENTRLMEQIKSLKGKDSIQKIDTSTQTSEKSFPSLEKMDEQGVHSPTNAKRSTAVDNKDTFSPAQTVALEDTSNPYGQHFAKSEGEGEEDYREHLYYQDAQDPYEEAHNPNEDDDSGMSFDSVTLHNLDT
ncbi:hypothetical protein H5410_007582 [Solanum commersonii]|uniref:Uncharacterized protein n=1 Tax=Solanum commersonii TaxID=4109 RepID=A0A9J6ADJ3_SOLCO|nr:hypothetical protein H5410_007582 [Solanum commersonii]